MKYIYLSLFILATTWGFAQTLAVPQGFTYQAVARAKNGKLLENEQLQVKVSLYATGSTAMFYGETHNVTTNRFGVFVLIVGQGTRYGGLVTDLKSVDFKNNQVDIKSEIQVNGAWETVGQQAPLWSVPYSLVAQKVIENDDADADPVNEIQTLTLNGNNLSLSKNGGSITLPADNDGDPQNEIQNLKLTDNTLTITNNSNATAIDLSKYVNTDDQTLSLKNRLLSISNGNTITLPEDKDSSTSNELQDLQLVGNSLQITNNSKATIIDLSKYTQALVIVGNKLSLSNGNTIILPAEKDSSTTNELQTLSLDGDSLVISGGNKIKMPTSKDNQTLKLFDTQLLISNGNAVDLSNLTPAGVVMPFAGDEANVPDGWLVCNGASVSATKYPRLFLAIGTAWGGSGNIFNLPDLRGMFLRGVDGSRNIDPDADSRTAINAGGNTGDKVGTYEDMMYQSHDHSGTASTNGNHTHNIYSPYGSQVVWENQKNKSDDDGFTTDIIDAAQNNGNSGALYTNNTGNHSHTITIGSNGGNETRPKNASVVYIIKY